MSNTETLLFEDQAPLDDCWNRIGVFGDKSCAQLQKHIHCRNCDVYGAAAIALLDRYGSRLEHDEDDHSHAPEDLGEQRSLLIFRLGDQWLAIASAGLAEVMPMSPIHSLPHRQGRGLLGVTNVRGTLVACLSLRELLGLDESEPPVGRRIIPRMLTLESAGGPMVTPVDEVSGIQRIPLEQITSASRDDSRPISRFTAGVLQWRGQSITVLDGEQVVQHMVRSLT